jgi:hypothetical protein
VAPTQQEELSKELVCPNLLQGPAGSTDPEKFSLKDDLDLLEKRRQNRISMISIAVTFIVAAASLLWNVEIQSQATRTADFLETSRVSNVDARSNSNGEDFQRPWRCLTSRVQAFSRTTGVGRTKKMRERGSLRRLLDVQLMPVRMQMG